MVDQGLKIPQLSPAMKKSMLDFWMTQKKYHDELDQKVLALAAQIPEFSEVLKNMSKEVMEKNNLESRERNRLAYEEGNWLPYLTQLRLEGAQYARMGISFSAWVQLLRLYKEVIEPYLIKDYGSDQPRLLAAFAGMNESFYIAMEGIGETYLATKEQVIRGHEIAIRELSTPVLKVRDRLLILPIIGIVDTQRARQVTEAMLNAIRDNRAKAVVMDITGVPMVDSKVANHLIQSVEAARLMGATVVITGLSPEIAQTLVALGANLPNIKTYGDLQGGLEEAEQLLNLEVVQRPKSPAQPGSMVA
jgi:rsbT co-antagonist protein RsbR